MMFLLQGQSDPLMLGRRKANLKCQSSMDISGVRTICIYEVIGWFRIGFVMSPVLEKKCWLVREQSSYQSWCERQEHRLYQLVLRLCNTRFIKGHKPSNHIRARIKSHV